MPKLSAAARAALKARVERASLAILAAGYPPSEKRLRDRVPGHGVAILIALRDELIAEGRIPWRPGESTAKQSATCGRTGGGLDEADDAEVRRRIAAVRRTKGDPPPHVEPVEVWTISVAATEGRMRA